MTHSSRPHICWLALGLAGLACDGQFQFDVPAAGAGSGGAAPSGAAGSIATGLAGGGGTSSNGVAGSLASIGGSSAAGCSTDAQCGLPSLHCEPVSGRCVECLTTGHCQAPNPACDTTAHRCVPCLTPLDCGPQEECETTTHKCQRSCQQDRDCGSSSLHCNVLRSACQECDDDDGDDHCSATTHCQSVIEVCVQCLSNADCSGTAPYCDPVSYTHLTLPTKRIV